MKKTTIQTITVIVVTAIATALLFWAFGPNPSRDFYGVAARVIYTDGDTTQVTNGFSMWEFRGTYGCDPFTVGDRVCLVLEDNGGLMDDDPVINVCYDMSSREVVAQEKQKEAPG